MPEKPITYQHLDSLLTLRTAVEFLGQKGQNDWWDCAFLDSTGIRFLETTYPRSARVAAARSTADAACRIHDKALGKIGQFHLFRLPLPIEGRMEEALAEFTSSQEFGSSCASDSAIEALERLADAQITAPAGPVQIGVEQRILTRTSIQELAAHYLSAFRQGIECFPYFAPDKLDD